MLWKELGTINRLRQAVIDRCDSAGVDGKAQEDLTDVMSVTDLDRMVSDGLLFRHGLRYWTLKTWKRSGNDRFPAHLIEDQISHVAAVVDQPDHKPDSYPGIPW